MSIKALEQAIRAQSDARICDIAAHAEEQAQQVIAQAEAEARDIRLAACREVTSPAAAERARLLNRAHRETLRLIGEAQTRLLNRIMTAAQEQLRSAREEPTYPQVLKTLVLEALERFKESAGADELMYLAADPRDEELLADLLVSSGIAVPVRLSLSCWGGVIILSDDGRVKISNTLESRLERAESYLRSQLMAQIAVKADSDKRVLEAAG
jgi:V/A-type H+-transporting ATPase subunit E